MQMADEFVAHASLSIGASRARAWDALVNPETIKEYTPVTDVISEWREEGDGAQTNVLVTEQNNTTNKELERSREAGEWCSTA
jgi:hypothetical protein